MLALLTVQVATGLVADDEIATTGPLNRFVESALALKATGWHKNFGQWPDHLAGGAAHRRGAVLPLRKRRNLIGPMWHGDKRSTPSRHADRSADGVAQRTLAGGAAGRGD